MYSQTRRLSKGQQRVEAVVNTGVNCALFTMFLGIGIAGETINLARELSATPWLLLNARLKKVR